LYFYLLNWVNTEVLAQRYKNSRIVAFSTACVYPFVDVHGPGASESLAPTPPGEYANSCVARERMFEHFSHEHQTPGCLLRLSYAIDMRYGVLHDVARTIWEGLPLSVAMGHANIIWQGDANDLALRALSACTAPTSAINLSGPPISIRDVATRLAARMGKTVQFTDTEASSAWLVDCHKADALWGPPSVTLDTLLDWTAAWVMQGHKSLDKPTHFEVRDGHY
jgi:nucleoside-diphosphate-sugar epimerase